MSDLVLAAPLAGWAAPLEETPDPVFAQKMMGEGLAIDPTGEALFAPCAGVVLKAHAAGHAVTLRTAEGADILMHIGLDTVALGGAGFEVHVRDGQAVAAGERLVSFDLDGLSQRARSLITPVLLTNPEAFQVEILASGREVAVGEPILRLVPIRAETAASVEAEGERRTLTVRITHAHGLHARPAALLAAEAKRWPAQIEVALGAQRADARSPVSVMALGVRGGDAIEIAVTGPDAGSVLAAFARAVEQINAMPAHAAAPERVPAPAPQASGKPGVIQGVAAAPGLAVGPAWRLRLPAAPVVEASEGLAAETARIDAAVAAARAQIEAGLARTAGDARAILEAHLGLLEDPALMAAALTRIAEGASAGGAWRDAVDGSVRALQALGDARLAERVADLRDLQQQVLWALSGRKPEAPSPPAGAILIADDLLPSELAALDGAGLGGVCTARGGPTSHVAVLAAAMDIPCVVAAGASALVAVPEGEIVILDGGLGRLEPRPDAARLSEAEAEIASRHARAEAALAAAAERARTQDGVEIAVLANVGSVADARLAARNGADGCGLLRTEFLFLDRERPPSEAEQLADYQAIAEALAGRPVTVRTLDVGGDKPAPYLDLAAEENPALGVRGLRVSLARPELFGEQLRAILRVSPAGQCRIMLPMVASVSEVEAARRHVERAAEAVGAAALPALGVMIETPAAAATADLIAPAVDFLSIGTNDLAQYTLAMDRGNPALAAAVDGLHPAVLRLIRLTAEAGARAGKPVSVCGGLASDPAAVPILIGLGVTQLSATPARAPEIKALVRTLSLDQCRALAQAACGQASAAEVRALRAPPPAEAPPARRGASA